MPPHGVIERFLPEADREALLAWAIGEQAAFKLAKVFAGDGRAPERVDPRLRIALKHYGIGAMEALLRQHLFAALPQIMQLTGYRGAEPRSIEFELNAYGDGAHFGPHIDVPVGANRRRLGEQPGEDRLISAVYYFFREPKAFSGGALRLYRFGARASECTENDSIAFEPVQNRLVVFPSWARHAVEPVSCRSNDFSDFRFALNCWLCGKLSTAG